MPEKKNQILKGNYVSEDFPSGTTVPRIFFAGMVPVVWLELLLKNNIFDKIGGVKFSGNPP